MVVWAKINYFDGFEVLEDGRPYFKVKGLRLDDRSRK